MCSGRGDFGYSRCFDIDECGDQGRDRDHPRCHDDTDQYQCLRYVNSKSHAIYHV